MDSEFDFWLGAVVIGIVGAILYGGIAYVVIHFILKFW